MITLLWIFYGLLLLGLLGLALVLANHLLTFADRLREIGHKAGNDLLQLWSSAHHAAIDIDRERSKLEISQEYAQMKLNAHRRQLRAENEVAK